MEHNQHFLNHKMLAHWTFPWKFIKRWSR